MRRKGIYGRTSKNAYQKIYAELCSLLIMIAALSILIKVLIFEQSPTGCMTELVIVIGAPVYLWIRQTMLGLDPGAGENARKRKKRFCISYLAGMVGLLAVFLLRNGLSAPALLLYAPSALTFSLVFAAVYILSRRFAKWNADKKAQKYEED